MAKSPIADLETELAAKRAKVKECEAALEKEREAVKEYAAKKLARAEETLRAAQEETDSYVAQIAQALGLPNPLLAKQAKQRRKRVRELLAEHKTPEQIAGELKLPLDVVSEDIARLSKATDADPTHKRGWKRERVRAMVAEGSSLADIASELDIGLDSVRAHVYQLRQNGRLPETSQATPPAPRERAPATSPAARPPEPSRPQPPTSEGDNILLLRREVARQQGDQKAKAAVLLAWPTNGHSHKVVVDRMGDGTTQSDDTGHVHKVYRFVVSQAADHQHGIRVPPNARES